MAGVGCASRRRIVSRRVGGLIRQAIVILLRVEGWHRDAKARGINIMSFVVSLLLARHSLAGAESRWWRDW